ncbi:MAG: type III-B CRISPR module RAMP protein Cmr4 [Gammaproteobacteria bacterium]|nr:type III-B CRISPR module RAMP protein Cmr4 [Gammaproteobacteria bacterium]
MSKTLIVGMLAETFIHPGSGQSAGALDQPVAREAATDYPFIAGSSLKGALKDKLAQTLTEKVERRFSDGNLEKLFGKSDNAGEIIVSDARLLLLPVRSLTGSYKWVTCPHLLERLQRDQSRCGQPAGFVLPTAILDKHALGGKKGAKIMLEERTFDFQGSAGSDVVQQLAKFMAPKSAQKRLDEQLVILSNNAFSWFAKFGLAVQARNQLKENKTSNNLWYEETLPPDTLMYTLLSERFCVKEAAPSEPASGTANVAQQGAVTQIKAVFDKSPYFQVGGNETVGQGWFIVKSLET